MDERALEINPDDQTMPSQPVDPTQVSECHHVHHSYIWLGSLQVAGVMVMALIISFVGSLAETLFGGGDDGMKPIVALIGLALVVVLSCIVAFLYQWRSYRHLWYELGPSEFSLHSGIFNKKRMHVPYARVQSVDQRASLLQRIFGVCTVSIDTAGGASHTAINVPYMRKDQAERLRMELYTRKRCVLGLENASDAACVASSAMPAPDPATMVAPAGAIPAAMIQPASQAAAAAPHLHDGNVLDIGAEAWDDVRGVFAGEAVDMGRSSYECRMTNKELVFTGLSNNTGFALALIGALATVFQVVGGIGSVAGSIENAGAVAYSIGGRLFGGSVVLFTVVVVLLVVLALWAVSVASSCIRFGGFVARRRGSRVEVEHGLLQHRIQGVDVDRVQSVVVKQSVIRRILGYCELSLGKIDAAGSSQPDQNQGVSQQGLVIHPFVKLDRVPQILEGIIPEFADIPVDRIGLPRVAVRRAVIRRSLLQGAGLWIAVIVACAQVAANLVLGASGGEDREMLSYINIVSVAAYAVCAIVFVLEVIAAILWARDSGFAYNRRFMQVVNGGMARETVSFPRRKIQFGYAKTNPFQRRAGTATIAVRTAAGTGGTTVQLVDVCEDDARAWLAWVRPRANAV